MRGQALWLKIARDYSFLVFNYSDAAWYWEVRWRQHHHPRPMCDGAIVSSHTAWCWQVVDFAYKVVMTAVMLLAPAFTADGQGSGPQLFAAAVLSFGFGCLHVAAWPYRRAEDNWLRLAVELEVLPCCSLVLLSALPPCSMLPPCSLLALCSPLFPSARWGEEDGGGE